MGDFLNALSGRTAFTLGFLTAALLFFHAGRLVERFRRARADLQAARKGIRTLVEMLINRGKELATAGFVIVVIIAGIWLGVKP